MYHDASLLARSRAFLNTLAISLPLPRGALRLDHDLQSEAVQDPVHVRERETSRLSLHESAKLSLIDAGHLGDGVTAHPPGPDRLLNQFIDHDSPQKVVGRPCPLTRSLSSENAVLSHRETVLDGNRG